MLYRTSFRTDFMAVSGQKNDEIQSIFAFVFRYANELFETNPDEFSQLPLSQNLSWKNPENSRYETMFEVFYHPIFAQNLRSKVTREGSKNGRGESAREPKFDFFKFRWRAWVSRFQHGAELKAGYRYVCARGSNPSMRMHHEIAWQDAVRHLRAGIQSLEYTFSGSMKRESRPLLSWFAWVWIVKSEPREKDFEGLVRKWESKAILFRWRELLSRFW